MHLRDHAAQAMDQAAEHLAQGQAPYARDAQRRASENVERGAQHAEDLAAALRAERLALAATAPAPANCVRREHPPLGEARAAVARAASQLDQARDPGQAGRAAAGRPRGDARGRPRPHGRRAGRRGRHRARASPRPTRPTTHAEPEPADRRSAGGSPTDPKSRPASKAETDLAELKEADPPQDRPHLGRAARPPPHRDPPVVAAAVTATTTPGSIQLYFREIAAGAAEKPAESPR